jgi:hypothetical protein
LAWQSSGSGSQDQVSRNIHATLKITADTALAYRGNDYCRNGVQEQIGFQIEDEQVDWFVPEGGSCLSPSAGEDGRIGSRMFPGLSLDVEALLERSYDTVLAALQAQTGSEAHRAFVEQLAAENKSFTSSE